MSNDINQWLEGLGLSKYEKLFAENDIDFDVLSELSELDLENIGVSLGDRKRLMKAAATLAMPVEQQSVQVSADVSPPSAERRQITVLFSDLVGSTKLSEQLDPEQLREVLRAYQEACVGIVSQYDGHIAKYIGDGLLVYFGYPQAHEDDAQRAVRTGLGIIAEVERLSKKLWAEKGIELGVHLGIHTGLVVAGEMGAGEVREVMAIVGETPNIAARLENLAAPNTVLISDNTRRLVEGLFIFEDLGPQHLKGISEPLTVHRVIGETEAPSRFEAAASHGLTSLVGREEEVGLLFKRWQQAKEGEGQVALLTGEAGIGKSRILRGFRERLENEEHNRVLYYGSAHHQNSALYPVINQFERALRFSTDDSQEQKLKKLENIIDDLGLSKSEIVPIISSLLSLKYEYCYPSLNLAPQQLKTMTFEVIITIAKKMAARNPLLIVFEDAHWIDPSTQELLDLYVERLQNDPILVVMTFRPEYEPPWTGHSHVTQLTLNRLSRMEIATLVARVAGSNELPSEVVEEIVSKTDGVPLFAEELTKMVLESDVIKRKGEHYVSTGHLESLEIPSSLQDSLMARLDRLASVKEVAQLAAALGRIFSYDLLAVVSELNKDELNNALEQLEIAELIYRRSLGDQVRYEFKHALVQDAAYHSLLKSARQQYHKRIALALEQRFPETAETEPELLAHHLTEAELLEQAIDYWHRAGRRASQRSANIEAISHLRKGLELIENLPATAERAKSELDLCVLLAPVLMAVKGFAATEVAEIYNRSEQLLHQVGATKHEFPVNWGLWYVKQHSGQIDAACEIADRLLPLAEKLGDEELLLQAHHAAWTSRFTREELHSVREHTERGIAIYDREKHHSHALLYGGHDPGICCRIIGGLTTLLLGYPSQARKLVADGIELSEKLRHAHSLALALSFSGTVFLYLRDPNSVRTRMDSLIALCEEHGLGHFGPMAKMLRGWADIQESHSSEGMTKMRDGLDAFRATGAKRLSFQLAILADGFSLIGKNQDALVTLDEAIGVIEDTGERRWEPEVYRLKGKILSSGSTQDQVEAEKSLKNAIVLSHNQDAKWFELRAAKDLADLLLQQQKENEARELLLPIFKWFTEGFETPDLKEVKTLLKEIA